MSDHTNAGDTPEVTGGPTTTPDSGSAEELLKAFQAIITKVEQLPTSTYAKIDELNRREKRQRKISRLIAAGLVLVALMTGAVAAVGYNVYQNAQRIDNVTKSLTSSITVQRQKVLCPLYKIILTSPRTQSDAQPPTPEEKKRLEETVKTIQEGYNALKCDSVAP